MHTAPGVGAFNAAGNEYSGMTLVMFLDSLFFQWLIFRTETGRRSFNTFVVLVAMEEVEVSIAVLAFCENLGIHFFPNRFETTMPLALVDNHISATPA